MTRSAFRALSFFAPSATFEAWMQVAELSRNALEATIDRLSALSLVDVLAGEERYALHPLTRNFVRDDFLTEARVAREVGARFAQYWVNYARRYGGSNRNYKTYNLLEYEEANLDAVAEWLWQTAAVQGKKVGNKVVARGLGYLTSALREFFWLSGRWDKRVQLNIRSYGAMWAMHEWSEAGWHAYDVAWIHYNRSDTESADYWAERCVEAWERGGNKGDQAEATRLRGLIAKQRRDYDEAERLLKDSLMIYRDLHSNEGVASLLMSLGNLEQDRDRYKAAELHYRRALALSEKLAPSEKEESRITQATVAGNLGLLSINQERWTEAREWYEKELSLAQELGQQQLISDAKRGLARVYEEEGRFNLALPLAQEALDIDERLRQSNLMAARELVERLFKKVGQV